MIYALFSQKKLIVFDPLHWILNHQKILILKSIFFRNNQLKIMVFWWLQERPINEDAVKIMKARAKVGPASVASEEDIAMRLLTR